MAVEACLWSAGFSPLEGERLVAPALMWSEASSALHALVARSAISRDLSDRALDRLLACPVAPRSSAGLKREAWRVADELGWAKTYDAEYVALARLSGERLVTLDRRLRRGAQRVVEVIGPADL